MRLSAGVLLGVIAALILAAPAASGQAPPVAGAEEASAQETGGDDGTDVDPGAPHEVQVGALINDIQQLDLQTHSYTADIYIWFKWEDPEIDPSRTFEFLNPFELWGHIRSYAGVKPEMLPDGTLYSIAHVQGKFNAKLPLERYPFDTQDLVVIIEDKNKERVGARLRPRRRPDLDLRGHHDPGLGHRRADDGGGLEPVSDQLRRSAGR